MAKHMPVKEPMFHQYEILIGAGRSIKELLIILKRGDVLRISITVILKAIIMIVLM
jgi:hypothetical protein